MEILYKKEKEEADQLLEQQRLVSSIILVFHFTARLGCRKVWINLWFGLLNSLGS